MVRASRDFPKYGKNAFFALSKDAKRELRHKLTGHPRTTNCHWCGGEFSAGHWKRTREHLVPRSLGGTPGHENIAAAHGFCNNERGIELDFVPFAVHQLPWTLCRYDSNGGWTVWRDLSNREHFDVFGIYARHGRALEVEWLLLSSAWPI